MTNKEAITVLECMAIDCMAAWTGLTETNPMYDVLNQRIEAIDMAQEALRRNNDEKDTYPV